jgi:hypothetical protein
VYRTAARRRGRPWEPATKCTDSAIGRVSIGLDASSAALHIGAHNVRNDGRAATRLRPECARSVMHACPGFFDGSDWIEASRRRGGRGRLQRDPDRPRSPPRREGRPHRRVRFEVGDEGRLRTRHDGRGYQPGYESAAAPGSWSRGSTTTDGLRPGPVQGGAEVVALTTSSQGSHSGSPAGGL